MFAHWLIFLRQFSLTSLASTLFVVSIPARTPHPAQKNTAQGKKSHHYREKIKRILDLKTQSTIHNLQECHFRNIKSHKSPWNYTPQPCYWVPDSTIHQKSQGSKVNPDVIESIWQRRDTWNPRYQLSTNPKTGRDRSRSSVFSYQDFIEILGKWYIRTLKICHVWTEFCQKEILLERN